MQQVRRGQLVRAGQGPADACIGAAGSFTAGGGLNTRKTCSLCPAGRGATALQQEELSQGPLLGEGKRMHNAARQLVRRRAGRTPASSARGFVHRWRRRGHARHGRRAQPARGATATTRSPCNVGTYSKEVSRSVPIVPLDNLYAPKRPTQQLRGLLHGCTAGGTTDVDMCSPVCRLVVRRHLRSTCATRALLGEGKENAANAARTTCTRRKGQADLQSARGFVHRWRRRGTRDVSLCPPARGATATVQREENLAPTRRGQGQRSARRGQLVRAGRARRTPAECAAGSFTAGGGPTREDVLVALPARGATQEKKVPRNKGTTRRGQGEGSKCGADNLYAPEGPGGRLQSAAGSFTSGGDDTRDTCSCAQRDMSAPPAQQYRPGGPGWSPSVAREAPKCGTHRAGRRHTRAQPPLQQRRGERELPGVPCGVPHGVRLKRRHLPCDAQDVHAVGGHVPEQVRRKAGALGADLRRKPGHRESCNAGHDLIGTASRATRPALDKTPPPDHHQDGGKVYRVRPAPRPTMTRAQRVQIVDGSTQCVAGLEDDQHACGLVEFGTAAVRSRATSRCRPPATTARYRSDRADNAVQQVRQVRVRTRRPVEDRATRRRAADRSGRCGAPPTRGNNGSKKDYVHLAMTCTDTSTCRRISILDNQHRREGGSPRGTCARTRAQHRARGPPHRGQVLPVDGGWSKWGA